MIEEFNREINRVDVGVRGLEVLQGNDGPQVLRFQHEGLAVPMPFNFGKSRNPPIPKAVSIDFWIRSQRAASQ